MSKANSEKRRRIREGERTVKEQRRFPRVTIPRALAEVILALQARVTWPNEETSDILDLSYKGMAVRRPGLFPIAVQQRIRLSVEFGGHKPFAANVRVAWCNLDWVGLELLEFTAEGHQVLHEYLDAKLVGASLKPVERVFFGEGQTFQFWYQAPGVHLFIWLNSQGLVERVRVHIAEDVVELDRNRAVKKFSARERRAFLLLSQVDKREHPMEEFVRTVGTGV